MKTIEIDDDIYKRLGQIAIPFQETSPNMVIRRLLDYYSGLVESIDEGNKKSRITAPVNIFNNLQSSSDEIEHLRQETPRIHQAFLTFLMDKYTNSHGNYRTADIISFMESVNLRLPSQLFRNPWMPKPYKNPNSCKNTIEHFRQPRKFGCWNGKDIKIDCDASAYCIYHPDNPDEIKDKCDLRKGAIWKRKNPDSPYVYGKHYLDVIKKELLNNILVPLQPLLALFYPNKSSNEKLIADFEIDFHMNDQEMELFE